MTSILGSFGNDANCYVTDMDAPLINRTFILQLLTELVTSYPACVIYIASFVFPPELTGEKQVCDVLTDIESFLLYIASILHFSKIILLKIFSCFVDKISFHNLLGAAVRCVHPPQHPASCEREDQDHFQQERSQRRG